MKHDFVNQTIKKRDEWRNDSIMGRSMLKFVRFIEKKRDGKYDTIPHETTLYEELFATEEQAGHIVCNREDGIIRRGWEEKVKKLYEELNLSINYHEKILKSGEPTAKFEEFCREAQRKYGDAENLEETVGADQRKIIESYWGNPVLCDALEGKKSINHTLTELKMDVEGIRKYLPRNVDIEYNKQVEQLGELVELPSGYLKRNGVFAYDNLANGILIGLILVEGIGLPVVNIEKYYPGTIPKMVGELAMMGGFVAGIWSGFVGKWRGDDYRGNNWPVDKKVEYIDQKIKKLF
jgi:hypothetical protein